MKTNSGSRRNRKQWQQLVNAWRRSRRSAAEFASESGVVESTLRWWAWRLERDASSSSPVALVPVRVVEDPAGADNVFESAGVAWTLRTPRGELTVYSPDESALRAAISSLIGGRA